MAEMKKIYIDDFMSDDEDEPGNSQATHIDNEKYEESKSKFDIKKLISSFILKKEYFISHKKSDIKNDYEIDKKQLGQGAFGTVFKGKDK